MLAFTSWGNGSLSHYLQGSIHPRWCRVSCKPFWKNITFQNVSSSYPNLAGQQTKTKNMFDLHHLHPWKLTCPLKSDHFSREYIFQPSIFRGHVSFQGGNLNKHLLDFWYFSISINNVCLIFQRCFGFYTFEDNMHKTKKIQVYIQTCTHVLADIYIHV